MITYLYECPVCQEFEVEHSIKTELKYCPTCEAKGEQREVRKLINGGGNGKGIMRLTGDEFLAKLPEETAKMKKEIHSSEKQYANVLGPDRYQKIQTQMDKARREKY